MRPPFDGTPFATLRDPFGAVVAVRAGGARPHGGPVAWHLLNTPDLERACSYYAELLGWAPEHGSETSIDGHRLVVWAGAGRSAGGMIDIAGRPDVHPHWLFFFPVTDLEAALAAVRRLGGTALEPVERVGGGSTAACEDPQGAAFGLIERP